MEITEIMFCSFTLLTATLIISNATSSSMFSRGSNKLDANFNDVYVTFSVKISLN